MTHCYDCGQKVTRPEKARVFLLYNTEHAVVLCYRCRPGRASERQYKPKMGLPPRPKVEIPGGEQS
ncbi:hypothetical protein [Halobellus inordinatus]|uniref:hypothetical protein n=1 Tax=Halobellus inordinatus TaxID=1126236 RepID=UPI00210AC025|nr:hypothetical protein [Halobellus inordinatus]